MAYLKQHPLISITLLAALLRLPTLAIESLWYDETFTAWLASLPPDKLIAATLNDVHPPTWYLLEWGMVQLFGSSPFTLRVLSALAGIALIPLVYRLARSFELGHNHGLAAAALTAIAPFQVYYSQEARAYIIIFLMTTIATIGVLEKRYWLLIISATVGLYLHNLAVLYVGTLVWLAAYRGFNWRYAASFFTVGLLWLPWVIFGLLPQMGDVSDGFWVRQPTIGTLAYVVVGWLFSDKAALLGMVTVPILVIALMQSNYRVDLLALLLIPVCLSVIVSMLLAPVLVGRVVGSSAIILYLVVAPHLVPTVTELRHSTLRVLPGLFFIVLAVFYPLYWSTERIGRYPWYFGLDDFLASQSPATDGIFHANLATYIVYHYYLPPDTEQFVWRQSNDLAQSLTNEAKWSMQMQQVDSFEDVACHRERWWIAFYENPTTGQKERAEVARIVKNYDARWIDTILQNDLVNARIYLIEDACRIAKQS